jgi:Protein of unknown function (DUF1592)/Protein of unknown function (DUF1588)/Protein of unknown function (DUF1595)/Protein of unknown function (DUF1587)
MTRLAVVLAFGLGSAACTGSIADGLSGAGKGPTGQPNQPGQPGPNKPGDSAKPATSSTPDNMDPTAPPPSAQVACPGNGQQTVGKRALRRMTNAELETTIRVTFGLDAKQWGGLAVPPDTASEDGFNNNVDLLKVGNEYARGSLDSGRKVAALVSAEPNLSRILPCATAGGAACATTFIDSIGTKLYRRPLTQVEKGRYTAIFDKVSKDGDFKAFVYWATATMLQSPHVIYRSELGEPDGNGRFKLTPYEVASELSYTLTGGPPSDALLGLAAANKLSTADEVEAAARALVFDGATVRPAFRDVLWRFSDQWLGLATLSNLKKDDAAYPDFKTDIQDALGEETRRLLSSVVLEEKGGMEKLLTAPYTFVDAKLSKFYGFGAATGTDFVKVDRPANWGIGVLAQGSMLAIESHSVTTSPTKRGFMVRARLMCNTPPPPPPVVNPLPEPTDAETTRQRYEMLHAGDPACKGCHNLMDPIGFAFEHLDATGRYRAKEGKYDIDDSGVVLGTTKGDLPFKGPTELANAIAKLPEISECAATHIAAYALGANRDSAGCLIGGATEELRQGGSLVDFFVRLTRSDHFRVRQP